MITTHPRWSHPHGNALVPSPWQATRLPTLWFMLPWRASPAVLMKAEDRALRAQEGRVARHCHRLGRAVRRTVRASSVGLPAGLLVGAGKRSMKARTDAHSEPWSQGGPEMPGALLPGDLRRRWRGRG
jgi:hypothetical protein